MKCKAWASGVDTVGSENIAGQMSASVDTLYDEQLILTKGVCAVYSI